MRAAIAIAAMLWAALMPSLMAAQDHPIRIGVLDDQSGPYADLSGLGSVTAAELAVADVGRVLGRRVEILSADHQNKADVGGAIARRWIDVDDVDMITGLSNTSVALAVRNVARAANKIDIVSGGGASDLTGKYCSPTSFHWVYDSYALAKIIGGATVKTGSDTFFTVAADYAFGAAMARDGSRFAEAAGGKPMGMIRAPLNTSDYSSFILQAQSSRAKVIMLAIAGTDLINFIKQAAEFGVMASGQKLASYIMFVNDVHALGLKAAQGSLLAEAFYWDQDDEARAFSKRFFSRRNAMPNSIQAGVYSAVKHYLTAVQSAGTTEGPAVAAKMRELPVEDFMTKGGQVRLDGRMLRDFFLFETKTPAESTSEWDLMKPIKRVSGDETFRPLYEGECPLVSAGEVKN